MRTCHLENWNPFTNISPLVNALAPWTCSAPWPLFLESAPWLTFEEPPLPLHADVARLPGPKPALGVLSLDFASLLLWLGFIYQTTATDRDHSEAALLPVLLHRDSPTSLWFCELAHILATNSFSVGPRCYNRRALVIQSARLDLSSGMQGAVPDTARELPSALSLLPTE